jgi:broad specificity phosphatase PhoE
MSVLFMLRHAQASFGAADYDRLSPLGLRQAALAAERLARLGVAFDAVYTGRLQRQRQTAQALHEAYTRLGQPLPTATELPDLDEYDARGVWDTLLPRLIDQRPELAPQLEGIHRDPRRFQHVFAELVRRWAGIQEEHPDLESWPGFRARVRGGLEEIMRREGPGRRVAVVTSAGPIAVAVQMATALPDAKCLEMAWQVLNASLTRFLYDDRRFTLAGFNDVAALESRREEGLLTYR